MSVMSVPSGSELALLLDFDGTVYVGDLPILSYARHASAGLEPHAQAAVIDGIRGLLEGRHTGRSTVDLSDAEDGRRAVELLAAAAGVGPGELTRAYAASRDDLAGSAFALDIPEGLVALLAGLHGPAWTAVVTDAPHTGVVEVLDSLGISGLIDDVITGADEPARRAAVVTAVRHRLARSGPDPAGRLVAVGNRWAVNLAPTHRMGGATAYIDRFGRGDGDPSWRAPTLGPLVPELLGWAAARTGTVSGRVNR